MQKFKRSRRKCLKGLIRFLAICIRLRCDENLACWANSRTNRRMWHVSLDWVWWCTLQCLYHLLCRNTVLASNSPDYLPQITAAVLTRELRFGASRIQTYFVSLLCYGNCWVDTLRHLDYILPFGPPSAGSLKLFWQKNTLRMCLCDCLLPLAPERESPQDE